MNNEIFVTLNEGGFPVGFWQSAAYADDAAPPQGAIQINEAQFADLFENQGARRWDGAEFVPYSPPVAKPSSASIDAERDRRIAIGFTFQGKMFQARDQDLRNINGATTGASVALAGGAQAGDFRWANPNTDFAWIAADNTMVPMDAPTVISFGLTAMAHVTRLTMAGRVLKNLVADGELVDLANEASWGG